MSGHKSFSKAVADWIDDHQWPKGSDHPQSILVIARKNGPGTVFEFQSAFGDLKVDGVYVKDANAFFDVHIQILAPGHHKGVTVAEAPSYIISTTEGIPISFDLDNGYVKGGVSFKYVFQNGRQNILATYSLHVPYTSDQKGTIDIAPTEITEAAGFTLIQLKDIPFFISNSELKEVGDKVLLSSETEQLEVLKVTSAKVLPEEQALLVKFLKDFVVDQDSIVLQTYYPPSGYDGTLTTYADGNASKQWHASVSFLGVLQLVASVDPEKLVISAKLQASVPILGHVHLVEIQGSLLGAGVTADLSILFAKGKVTFSASKNNGGKYELYVDAELDVKFLRAIKTNGKKRIAFLPFRANMILIDLYGRNCPTGAW